MQIAAGMGDGVTEAELAALLSSLSNVARRDIGGGGEKLDFGNFVQLFRGVF